MAKCIYCLHENVTFNREHVIPETLGTFEPKNMVLNNKVCQECNKYFGDNLEPILSNYSYLALLKTGIWSPLKKRLLGSSKGSIETSEALDITLPINNVLDGAHLIIRTADLKIDLQTQIGFRREREDGRYDYYPYSLLIKRPELLRREAERVKKYGKDGKSVFAIFHSDELSDIQSLLSKYGINLMDKQTQELPLPKDDTVLAKIVLTINDKVKRGLAKIAFNYFAEITKDILGKDYIYRDIFDALRKYIRYGENIYKINFIDILNHNVLADETGKIKINVEGHLLGVSSSGAEIFGIVYLFKRLPFRVLLGKPKIGITINKAHFFNLTTRKINSTWSKKAFDIKNIALPGDKRFNKLRNILGI